jgi:hypothetical protein
MDTMPVEEVNSKSGYLHLFEDLTSFAAEKLVKKFEARTKYSCFRKDKTAFYVKARELEEFCQGMAEPEFHKAIIPCFERTRVISLVHGSESSMILLDLHLLPLPAIWHWMPP